MGNRQTKKKFRGRKLLLATAALSTGGLLNLGCTEQITSNPKGSWYDDSGYVADAGDASSPLISNPKGSWYDDGGYPDNGDAESASSNDAGPTDDAE